MAIGAVSNPITGTSDSIGGSQAPTDSGNDIQSLLAKMLGNQPGKGG